MKLGPKAKAIVSDLLKLAKDPKYTEETLSLLDEIGVLETDDQRKAMAGFLGNTKGINSYHAQRVIVAQGKEVSIPIFKEALLDADENVRQGGIMGLYMVGDKNKAEAIDALNEVMAQTKDPKWIKHIDKAIRELKEPKK